MEEVRSAIEEAFFRNRDGGWKRVKRPSTTASKSLKEENSQGIELLFPTLWGVFGGVNPCQSQCRNVSGDLEELFRYNVPSVPPMCNKLFQRSRTFLTYKFPCRSVGPSVGPSVGLSHFAVFGHIWAFQG